VDQPEAEVRRRVRRQPGVDPVDLRQVRAVVAREGGVAVESAVPPVDLSLDPAVGPAEAAEPDRDRVKGGQHGEAAADHVAGAAADAAADAAGP